jgi:hypothetical protein
MTLTDEQRAKVEVMVHTSVMGYTYAPDHNGEGRWHDGEGNRCAIGHDVPPYTTSGDAMLEVIEKMRERNLLYSISPSGDATEQWRCVVWNDGNKEYVYAPTMQEAVCLAALSAVGVDWRAELVVKEVAE